MSNDHPIEESLTAIDHGMIEVGTSTRIMAETISEMNLPDPYLKIGATVADLLTKVAEYENLRNRVKVLGRLLHRGAEIAASFVPSDLKKAAHLISYQKAREWVDKLDIQRKKDRRAALEEALQKAGFSLPPYPPGHKEYEIVPMLELTALLLGVKV